VVVTPKIEVLAGFGVVHEVVLGQNRVCIVVTWIHRKSDRTGRP